MLAVGLLLKFRLPLPRIPYLRQRGPRRRDAGNRSPCLGEVFFIVQVRQQRRYVFCLLLSLLGLSDRLRILLCDETFRAER